MKIINAVLKLIVAAAIFAAGFYILNILREKELLKKVIERLSAESRIAQVLVTAVKQDPVSNKLYTTIKFLEYDTRGKALSPKYFTFSGNIIQFQSLVIRFDDYYVKEAHPLKGKSAYLFMKAFYLADTGVEVFEINKVNQVPSGYSIGGGNNFESKLWRNFWRYALDLKEAKKVGVKNAQIEAPGTKFVPGMLYTVKIEHDGGMRIDAQEMPEIVKGEKIDF